VAANAAAIESYNATYSTLLLSGLPEANLRVVLRSFARMKDWQPSVMIVDDLAVYTRTWDADDMTILVKRCGCGVRTIIETRRCARDVSSLSLPDCRLFSDAKVDELAQHGAAL
jgi:hypothetical protein